MKNKVILYKLYKDNLCVAYIRYDGIYYYSQTDLRQQRGLDGYLSELAAAVKAGYVDLAAFRKGLPPQFRLEVAK